jgi:hypothetical protein
MANQALHARIRPQRAGHGVKDSGFDGVDWIVGIGPEAEPMATVLVAVVFIIPGPM